MTATLPAAVLFERVKYVPGPAVVRGVPALSMRLPRRALRREYAEWSLLSVVAGVGSLVTDSPALSAVLLAVFLLLGPGLALFSLTRFPVVVVAAVTPIFGLATAAAVTALLAQFGRFPTDLLLFVGLVGTAAAASVTVAATRDITTPLLGRRLATVGSRLTALPSYLWGARLPVVLAALGVIAWAVSLPMLRSAPYSEYGLLDSRGGPVLIAAGALLVASFLTALRAGRLALCFVAILLLILALRGTVALITEMPIYGWTYKHIGVAEYLQTYRMLPPKADIYGQWPALFSLSAWFSSVAGIGLVSIASVFAPMVHVLLALCVIALSRVLGYSRRSALAAAMVAEMLNWVGQDYYSPQALALVLALAVLVVLLCSRRLPRAAVLGAFLFACLVPLHQLTPYWLLLVMGALVVTRRIKPWWILVVCGALLAAYLWPRMSTVAPYGLLSGLNPFENAQSNIAVSGGDSKFFTSAACRLVSGSAFVAAGLSAIVLWRRKSPVWPPIAMAASAVVMLAGVSYGGEAIFRVFLYSVPGLAILIGPAVVAMVRGRRSVPRQIATATVALATLLWFLVAGMQGYFGLWGQVTVSRAQYDVAKSLMAQDGNVRIVPLFSGGIPTRSSSDYVDKADRDRSFDAPLPSSADPAFFDGFPGDIVRDTTEQAMALDGKVYMALTEQDMRALKYYRYVDQSQLDEFTNQLQDSRYWHEIDATPDLRVFELDRNPPPPAVDCVRLPGWFC